MPLILLFNAKGKKERKRKTFKHEEGRSSLSDSEREKSSSNDLTYENWISTVSECGCTFHSVKQRHASVPESDSEQEIEFTSAVNEKLTDHIECGRPVTHAPTQGASVSHWKSLSKRLQCM